MKEQMELLFSAGDDEYFVRAYVFMSDQQDLLIIKKRRPGRDDEVVAMEVYTNKPIRESTRPTWKRIAQMTVFCDFEANLDGAPYRGNTGYEK